MSAPENQAETAILERLKRPIHILCCEEGSMVALCGHIAKERTADWTEVECVVCEDLEDTNICPVRGFCHLVMADD